MFSSLEVFGIVCNRPKVELKTTQSYSIPNTPFNPITNPRRFYWPVMYSTWTLKRRELKKF